MPPGPAGREPDQPHLIEGEQLVREQADNRPGQVPRGPSPVCLGPGIGVRRPNPVGKLAEPSGDSQPRRGGFERGRAPARDESRA